MCTFVPPWPKSFLQALRRIPLLPHSAPTWMRMSARVGSKIRSDQPTTHSHNRLLSLVDPTWCGVPNSVYTYDQIPSNGMCCVPLPSASPKLECAVPHLILSSSVVIHPQLFCGTSSWACFNTNKIRAFFIGLVIYSIYCILLLINQNIAHFALILGVH